MSSYLLYTLNTGAIDRNQIEPWRPPRWTDMVVSFDGELFEVTRPVCTRFLGPPGLYIRSQEIISYMQATTPGRARPRSPRRFHGQLYGLL
jgi:hypothetical protein